MSQTKNYKFCDFSTLSGVTVTFTTGASYNSTYSFFTCTSTDVLVPLLWTIPQALPEDLIVYYSFYSKVEEKHAGDAGFTTTYEGVSQTSVLFAAGQTSIGFDVAMTSSLYCLDWGGNFFSEVRTVRNSWTLDDQPILPSECTDQPVGCGLAITGVTTTTPTSRGAADGTIHVHCSGVTGTSVSYKLNGVTYATVNASSYTYTGLTTGVYQVAVYNGYCYDLYDVQLPDGQFSTGALLQTQPSSLAAANNPVVLTLRTAQNAPAPVFAKSTIKIATTVTENDTITFVLNYPLVYSATFTAKNFPDRNTYFLTSILNDQNGALVGSNTTSEIASSIAECIQNDLVLNRLYYISTSGAYIYLVAREATPNLNLTNLQVNISNTSSIQLTTNLLGVATYDGQLTADYSLYAEIFVNPALQYGESAVESQFVRVAELELPYQKDNIHRFQLETVLKNYVSSPAVSFVMTGFTTIPTYDCSYYCRIGEKFPLIANSNTKKKRYKTRSSYSQVCNAALNYEDPNNMSGYTGTAATGLNPYFGYTYIGNTVIVLTGLTTSTAGTGTTNVRSALYSGATKMFGWTNSGSGWSYVPTGQYTAKVTGITDGHTFTVTKIMNVNAYNLANGLCFYYSPTTVLPRSYINWLTNSPARLSVQRDSKQYLSFLLEKGYASATRTLNVKGDLYFYNGTSVTGMTFFNLTSGSTTNFGGCTMLAAGYDELGLAAYENSGNTKIRRVDFYVNQNDAIVGDLPLTDIKTFIYEIDSAPTRFGVAFLNKLGTWDVFDFVGEVVYDEEVTRQTYQVPRELNSDGSSPDGFIANSVYDTQYTKRITANSGTIDLATYTWLQELLQSNRVYSYTSPHQNYLIVESYTAQQSTNVNEYSIAVTFKESLYENGVTT